MGTVLTVGTRGSALALAQAHATAASLVAAFPDVSIRVQEIVTRGDATQAANVPLSSFGEKGIFAKELETALLNGTIDLAVHSMKDMAHTLPEGLTIAAVPEREDARDAWIGPLPELLPTGARVGTGSVRRKALLRTLFPHLETAEIRGNIDSRLRKQQSGQYDAICLAAAGLNRLGLQHAITHIFDPNVFVPDPGQGALALQTRVDDTRTLQHVQALDHLPSHQCIRAERAFLAAIAGGCQTPCGAYATLSGTRMSLTVFFGGSDGGPDTKVRVEGDSSQPVDLGHRAADMVSRS